MKRKSLTVILTAAALIVALGTFGLAQTKKAEPQTAKVTINSEGFQPGTINLKANVPAKITFLRQASDSCATEVLIPDYKIKKELPLNKAVDVEFTPTKSGELAFTCGMSMYRGKIVVK
jgi:plastocyanin domain-containing protein